MPLKKRVVKAVKKTSDVKKKTTVKSARRSILSPKSKVVKKIVRKTPTRAKQIVANQELKIEESKYNVGPVIQKFEQAKTFELPSSYGDNRIVLMVRDPYWVYAYWEISQSRIEEIKNGLGQKFNSSSLILRIYDTSNWRFFDINVNGNPSNWYINVGRPNTSYCIDIGYLTPDGSFIVAARSNVVSTPRDKLSEVVDEEWMIPDWEMMYALSGGFGRGKGSFEVREIVERRQWTVPFSGISSFSSPVRKPESRPFWLVANCELIVYGATEPTAKLTVQGAPVELRKDGTFSLRFSLPDGEQTIPIEAIRDDGKEKRQITPIVNRRTQ